MRVLTRSVWAVAILMIVVASAAAQTSGSRESGSDAGREWQPLAPTTPPTPAESQQRKEFRIILTAPVLATDNAIGAAAADTASPTKQPDVHLDPDLLVKWTRQFESIKVTAGADISFDRFLIHADQNTDTLYGVLKVAWTDGRSDLFVPYAASTATLDFRPIFSSRDDALFGFAAGFTSGIGFDPHGRLIPFRDATAAGDWSMALDVAAGRRLADPRDFQNVFFVAALDIVYNPTRNLLLGITPKVRLQWYEDYFGSPRRDLRLGWLARAEWTPDWLTRRIPGAELDFTVEFLRNLSTLAIATYSQWEGGPALVLTWRF